MRQRSERPNVFSQTMPDQPVWRRLWGAVIDHALALRGLDAIYHRAAEDGQARSFPAAVLRAMAVRCEILSGGIDRIPETGGVIVVANHPFGGTEGVALCDFLHAARKDARVLANYMLARVPEMRPHLLFVDPFERRGSAGFNAGPMRAAVRHVRDGGVLGVFPSGEVSHLSRKNRVVTDPDWSPSLARLVRLTKAPVLPMFFEGQHGPLFHLAGMIHPRLRTVMLPHLFARGIPEKIQMRIGRAVAYEKLAGFASDSDMVAYLRMRTYSLKPASKPVRVFPPLSKAPNPIHLPPVIQPVDPALLLGEVAGLSQQQCLVESNDLQTWIAGRRQIPHLLREIGRLREITFRLAGEGSGKRIDIDRFDAHYMHMFVWNRRTHEVVGAYRLGRTDRIIARHGIRGLYTHTLFKLDADLLRKINPALELGRSFVRREYQRDPAALAMLWRGIARYVARRPRYKQLFGPVSISDRYQTQSQQLLIAFLKAHAHLPELAQHAHPRNPPRWTDDAALDLSGRLLDDVKEVGTLIDEIEGDRKGVPVLVRQYLRMNAKFLCCNVDRKFSGVLDGLMIIDMTSCDRRILSKYMGAENIDAFFAYHGRGELVGAAG